jgi:hypothetical protein
MKNKFLGNELWILSISGAFQRAKIYAEHSPEKRRIAFRQRLRDKVLELYRQYGNPVSEQQHVTNIADLIECTKDDILMGGKLKFGSAQKLFNLFLKYEWCRGLIVEPPHCPVDRIVLTELNKYNPECWTKISGPQDYMKLITLLKSKAISKSMTLSEWELDVFNRRNILFPGAG